MKRNDPRSDLSAHLFADDDVADAAGGEYDGGTTREKVTSLCSRVSSYGPFYPADFGHASNDGGICRVCLGSWNRRRSETSDGDTAKGEESVEGPDE